jgi:hypothetical protein
VHSGAEDAVVDGDGRCAADPAGTVPTASRFVMPAHSGFYAGDVRGLDWTTFPSLGCYHIVTMDPPWVCR